MPWDFPWPQGHFWPQKRSTLPTPHNRTRVGSNWSLCTHKSSTLGPMYELWCIKVFGWCHYLAMNVAIFKIWSWNSGTIEVYWWKATFIWSPLGSQVTRIKSFRPSLIPCFGRLLSINGWLWVSRPKLTWLLFYWIATYGKFEFANYV